MAGNLSDRNYAIEIYIVPDNAESTRQSMKGIAGLQAKVILRDLVRWHIVCP